MLVINALRKEAQSANSKPDLDIMELALGIIRKHAKSIVIAATMTVDNVFPPIESS